MWLLFARVPRPDATYWPGRRWFAALDAVAWPAAAGWALNQIPGSGGLVLAMTTALLLAAAGRRLFIALLANHRYHFTTVRWARALACAVVVGALLKLGLPA